MKKKTYKQMQRRLLKATAMAIREQINRVNEHAMRINAQEDAKFYKDRLFSFGSNVETVEPGSGKLVECLKWTIDPKAYGNYCMTTTDKDILQILPDIEDSLVKRIAKELIERGVVQFIVKGKEEYDYDPFVKHGTVGAKLYVVPWEQMPHKRKIELMQYAQTERLSND